MYTCSFMLWKKLHHLINDIKLDTVLNINKPLTKTSRTVARGRVRRFPFCAFCIPLIWMEHQLHSAGICRPHLHIEHFDIWNNRNKNEITIFVLNKYNEIPMQTLMVDTCHKWNRAESIVFKLIHLVASPINPSVRYKS